MLPHSPPPRHVAIHGPDGARLLAVHGSPSSDGEPGPVCPIGRKPYSAVRYSPIPARQRPVRKMVATFLPLTATPSRFNTRLTQRHRYCNVDTSHGG